MRSSKPPFSVAWSMTVELRPAAKKTTLSGSVVTEGLPATTSRAETESTAQGGEGRMAIRSTSPAVPAAQSTACRRRVLAVATAAITRFTATAAASAPW